MGHFLRVHCQKRIIKKASESPLMAVLVAALGLVAGAVAVGMLAFGARLQPSEDP